MRSSAAPLSLRLRGTFIDISDTEGCLETKKQSQVRSCSQPISIGRSSAEEVFADERSYVELLSDKLATLTTRQELTAFFTDPALTSEKLATHNASCRHAGSRFSGGRPVENSARASSTRVNSSSSQGNASTSERNERPSKHRESSMASTRCSRGDASNEAIFTSWDQLAQSKKTLRHHLYSSESLGSTLPSFQSEEEDRTVPSPSSCTPATSGSQSPVSLRATPLGAPPPLPAGQACNSGSLGHPEICGRPCLYFAAGSCGNGLSCDYCHMDHPKRPARLDKRHREMLRNMPLKDWALMALPTLQAKVKSLDSSPETMELLADITRLCGIEAWPEVVSVMPNQQKFTSTLKSMTLRTLLAELRRSVSASGQQAADASINNLLHHLRQTAMDSAQKSAMNYVDQVEAFPVV